MDHMAECVRQNKTPYTPGEEGLQDQRIMEAIYQSAQENRPVKLPAVSKMDAFRGNAAHGGGSVNLRRSELYKACQYRPSC